MRVNKKLKLVEKLYEDLPPSAKGLETFKAIAEAAKLNKKVVDEYERIMKMGQTAVKKTAPRRRSRRTREELPEDFT
jgi:hypothetical protein